MRHTTNPQVPRGCLRVPLLSSRANPACLLGYAGGIRVTGRVSHASVSDRGVIQKVKKIAMETGKDKDCPPEACQLHIQSSVGNLQRLEVLVEHMVCARTGGRACRWADVSNSGACFPDPTPPRPAPPRSNLAPRAGPTSSIAGRLKLLKKVSVYKN